MDINYRLSSLNETEFRMDFDFDYGNFDISEARVEFGHEIKPLNETGQLIISAKVVIIYGENCIELASDTIRMGFEVSPFDEFITKKDQDQILVKFPAIMDSFIMAAIGTLRGVLMKNLKGTPLECVLLPLVPLDHIRTINKTD